jgi:hypothetical protein
MNRNAIRARGLGELSRTRRVRKRAAARVSDRRDMINIHA